MINTVFIIVIGLLCGGIAFLWLQQRVIYEQVQRHHSALKEYKKHIELLYNALYSSVVEEVKTESPKV